MIGNAGFLLSMRYITLNVTSSSCMSEIGLTRYLCWATALSLWEVPKFYPHLGVSNMTPEIYNLSVY